MSSEVPYIGSKISLISKAKVRYEGYLYTIDQEKLTVTLAKVKTFGTETRTEEVVPPKNEIYEYVVFRGKDIEDLVVCETPQRYSQDPAIVQTGSATHAGNVGPSFDNNQQAQHHNMQQPPFNSNTPYYGYGPYGGNAPNTRQYGMNVPPPQMQQQPPISQPRSQPVVKPKEETVNGGDTMDEKPRTSSTSGTLSYSSAASSTVKSNTSGHHSNRQKADARVNKGEYDSNKRNDEKKSNNSNHVNKNDDKEGQRRDSSERKPRQRRSHDGQGSNLQKPNQNKPKSTFTEEFDFQSSNAKFNKEEIEEELLQKLRKSLKLPDNSESSANDDEQSNSSVNSNSVSLADELPSPDRCYDKTKSFFDSISCEAGSGKNDRFRSQERKLNVETFGVGSSSYRGHSYSRGRGRGGRGGRGGWSNNRNNRGRGNWSSRGRDNRPAATTTNSDER